MSDTHFDGQGITAALRRTRNHGGHRTHPLSGKPASARVPVHPDPRGRDRVAGKGSPIWWEPAQLWWGITMVPNTSRVSLSQDVIVRVLVVLHMAQFFDITSDFLDQVVFVPNY